MDVCELEEAPAASFEREHVIIFGGCRGQGQ